MKTSTQKLIGLGAVLWLSAALAAEPAASAKDADSSTTGVEGAAHRTGELIEAGAAGTGRVLRKTGKAIANGTHRAAHAVAEGTRPVGNEIGEGGKAIADKTHEIVSGEHGRKAAAETSADDNAK